MKVYVASRVKHTKMWQAAKRLGEDTSGRQWQIVSSWIDRDEVEDYREFWAEALREVASADRLILYVGRGDFPLKGALVEVGAALALGIPVFMVLESGIRESLEYPSLRPLGSWAMHPSVKWCDQLIDAFRE